MDIAKTYTMSVTSTAAPLEACGPMGQFDVLIRNAGANDMGFSTMSDGSSAFTIPAGAAARLPLAQPEKVYLVSASGTTADIAYFA